MKRVKVMVVFGTRPESIKMAPVIKELKKAPDKFEVIVTVTAQHREMLDQVLEIFDILPDYDLDIMKKSQTLSYLSSSILEKMDNVMKKERPDIVLVHGDTTTSFITSLVAFYNQIKIGHVESGLRTYEKYNPFPEEMNRQMTDVLADIYFAPTQESYANLLNEGRKEDKIYITGNTVIDALKTTIQNGYQHEVMSKVKKGSKTILLTVHRKENLGQPIRSIFSAVAEVVEQYPDVEIIYPVHPNPVIQKLAYEKLGNKKRIHLIEPLNVVEFHNLMKDCYLILSDSGGIQEEAPSLGVPVFVLREHTERQEGVNVGVVKMIGTSEKDIIKEVKQVIEEEEKYKKMKDIVNPYGDGFASQRIVQALLFEFGLENTIPKPFTFSL